MRAILTLALLGCTPPGSGQGENILVIISDDIGADKTGVYSVHEDTYTPTLDGLAAEGMRFTHAYSSPTCSPSRATLLTGRHPSKTGIGRWILPSSEVWDLSLDELTIPEMLGEVGYTSAAVGKWHQVRFSRARPGRHPLRQGFAHHRGSLANPEDSMSGLDGTGYFRWEKNDDGRLSWSTTYMTTDTVDEAIAMVEELPEPWFLWVAMNAAHAPLHVPPDPLNPLGVTEDSSPMALFDADTLAFDMELERLLDSIDPEVREDLTIVYVADNGSWNTIIREPYDRNRGKGSTFELGVNVPMIVTGPHVAEPGSTSEAFVNFADLFPTLAELAGVDTSELEYGKGPRRGERVDLDGESFLRYLDDPMDTGTRAFNFSEAFYPNGPGPYDWRRRTVRSKTHKVRKVVDSDGELLQFFRLGDALYDEGNPLDVALLAGEDLLQYEQLTAELARLETELAFSW